MRVLFVTGLMTAAIATCGWSADDTLFAGSSAVYSGASSGLVYAWSYQPGMTSVQESSGGADGGACFHMSGTSFGGAFGICYDLVDKTTTLSQYDHVAIQIKAGSTISAAHFQLSVVGASQYPESRSLPVSKTGYAEASIPLSSWSATELAGAGAFLISVNTGPDHGPIDCWFDNVILVKSASRVLAPLTAAASTADPKLFPRAGLVSVRIFGVNGSLVSSRTVAVTAHSAIADVLGNACSFQAPVALITGAGVSVTQKIFR